MVDQGALIRAFADYARTMAGRYEIGDVLYRLTDQSVEALGVDGVGVSLGDEEGALRFVTATDERIVRVEEQQIEVGQGPCHDAFHAGAPQVSADLNGEDRWPDFTRVVLEQGCQAVAGIPMVADRQRIGALDLYRNERGEWSRDTLEAAGILADVATGYIVNARTLIETLRVNAQLQHALDSRVVVEQAKGILAERHGTDPAAAFDRLRTYARSRNRKVHAVAQAVVDGRLQL